MGANITGEYEIVAARTASRSWKCTLRLWWQELFASVFSIACLVANIAVLRRLDGQAYTSWRVANFDVTPNTLISVLSSFSKASFLMAIAGGLSQLKWMHFRERARRLTDMQAFDDASRGPLGAAKLVVGVRSPGVLALFGALITVLALMIVSMHNGCWLICSNASRNAPCANCMLIRVASLRSLSRNRSSRTLLSRA